MESQRFLQDIPTYNFPTLDQSGHEHETKLSFWVHMCHINSYHGASYPRQLQKTWANVVAHLSELRGRPPAGGSHFSLPAFS